MSLPDPIPAYVALGANLGDRERNIRAAAALLAETPGVSNLQLSSLYDNPAVGGPPDSPAFLNAAASLLTTLAPDALLARLLEIERSLGRERREKWGPRTIDLDLLLYGDTVLQSPGLVLPHPRMHERRFVLAPLAELAPELNHPVLGRTVEDLLRTLDQSA